MPAQRMLSDSHPRSQANRWLALTVAATLLTGVLLRAFPPGAWPIYPACPFHQWTGLLCPGCGGTRALAALSRGDLHQAMQSNGLVVVAFALGAAWLAVAYLRALRNRAPVWPHIPAAAVVAATASTLIFAVARNLL